VSLVCRVVAVLNSLVNNILKGLVRSQFNSLLLLSFHLKLTLIYSFLTAGEVSKLASYKENSTISFREIRTSVRLIFTGELLKPAIFDSTEDER